MNSLINSKFAEQIMNSKWIHVKIYVFIMNTKRLNWFISISQNTYWVSDKNNEIENERVHS